MIKTIFSLLIFLNPTIGLLVFDQALTAKSPSSEAFFVDAGNTDQYRLPLSEEVFLASQFLPIYPIRNWTVPEPEITAKTALIFDAARQKILWQKNGMDNPQPIASITKLMTALVIMENAKIDDVFTVSKEAISAYGEMGDLKVGEQLSVKDLLFALLLESSNDAAEALRENLKNIYKKDLVELMNKKASDLNLANTTFADSSGLDPKNQSSARDLTKIMQEVLNNQTLREVIKSPSIDIVSADGLFRQHFSSTNKLLQRFPDEVLGGKTGYTEEAGNCMILGFKAPDNQGNIISVVMDSQDRMGESAALLEWTKTAFLW